MADLMELRGSLESPQTPLQFPAEWLLDIFNAGRTDSGIRVSELTALKCAAVLACVQIICRAVASLPLYIYNVETVEGRRARYKATDHDLYKMLLKRPNPEMSAHVLRSAVQLHMLLWGNGYVEIQRNQAGDPIALWPRNPAQTRPLRTLLPAVVQNEEVPKFSIIYQTADSNATQVTGPDHGLNTDVSGEVRYRPILAKNMLHMPGLSLDGRIGSNFIWFCRQAVGLCLATEKYAAKFFGNGAVPLGLLQIPEVMEPKSTEELRRQWHEAHGGENAHKLAVLENGMKYQQIASNPDASQLNAVRAHQITEVAALFNVPQHMLPSLVGTMGNPSGSAKNLESQGIEFLTFCLAPWLDTWVQEIDRKLLYRPRGKYYECGFDDRVLRMPDAASRSSFYNTGMMWGFLVANDVRDMEHMPPIAAEWAERLMMPKANQIRTDKPAPPTQEDNRMLSFRHVFKDALIRATTRHKPSLQVYANIFEPILEGMLRLAGEELGNITTNQRAQAVIAGLYDRWGKHRGGVVDLAVEQEVGLAVSGLA